MPVFAIYSSVVLFRVCFAPRFGAFVKIVYGAHVMDLKNSSQKSMANTAETPLRNKLQIMAAFWLFSSNHLKLQRNTRLSGIPPFTTVT